MLLEDSSGENFPWKPKGIKDILKGATLVNNKQEETSVQDLAGKVVGFYFSAHWVCNYFVLMWTVVCMFIVQLCFVGHK